MSVAIKTDEKKEWQISTSVEGESHDHCVNCGTDVEATNRFGGEHGTPLLWEQYSHDMRKGGCGAAWTRTTPQGLERNTRNDAPTKWLTTAGTVGRVYSLPSRQFESNYRKAFGHE